MSCPESFHGCFFGFSLDPALWQDKPGNFIFTTAAGTPRLDVVKYATPLRRPGDKYVRRDPGGNERGLMT